jgi:hypothetical protein
LEIQKNNFHYAKVIKATKIHKVGATQIYFPTPHMAQKTAVNPCLTATATYRRAGRSCSLTIEEHYLEGFMKLFVTNKTSRLLAGMIALAAATVGADVLAATASGTANATVIMPISISAGTALNFGTFAANSGGGTVVITTASARSATGTVALSATTPGVAGTFTVTGNAGSTFAITNPGTFNVTSGANSMSVSLTGLATIGTLTAGTATIQVPGTLTVGASQAPGSYTGTYNMAVEYN